MACPAGFDHQYAFVYCRDPRFVTKCALKSIDLSWSLEGTGGDGAVAPLAPPSGAYVGAAEDVIWAMDGELMAVTLRTGVVRWTIDLGSQCKG